MVTVLALVGPRALLACPAASASAGPDLGTGRMVRSQTVPEGAART